MLNSGSFARNTTEVAQRIIRIAILFRVINLRKIAEGITI